MTPNNLALLTRRELLVHLCRMLDQGTILDEIDRLPVLMRPRHNQPIRCCVHKDRAILKYKLMALLAFNVDDETDELCQLHEYAATALKREKLTPVAMTVVDEACSSCNQGSYEITNLCRGCDARPCEVNCPKKAVSFADGKARINHDSCINCGKCMKECPFHAIVYQPVPCEESCPVGAIEKDDTGIERINFDKCIFCGKCIAACPYGAIVEKTHLVDVFRAWKSGRKVVALVAPAIAGQFRQDLGKIYSSILSAGFHDIVEVAEGADLTIANESAEWKERMAAGCQFMTTSCCPAFKELVKKHIPEMSDKVSSTPSPLCYAAEIARKRFPDAVTVFIGPCIAKRVESYYLGSVDFMMSFEELGALLVAKGIEVADLESHPRPERSSAQAYHFAYSGGVAGSIVASAGSSVNAEVINGIDKKSITLLKQMAKGKTDKNFVEVMCCEGGCLGGVNTLIRSPQAVEIFKKNLEA
ncbi:MAG TPA: monomeric [FeFe] hydrogenase [Bacteroidales bacterium]|nr:monomeric [FeFe] hydrogenase [Bacteroidales bacterium]HPT01816.1 monomeric [FeFe] hydrogenase [Bacteroidales bacterium]